MRPILAVALIAASSLFAAGRADCDDCVEAQYWQVDPGFWASSSPDLQSFPERQLSVPLPGGDLGLAFSGGGTRAASAAIGQLRGLVQNHWIERAKYITAVSGGSWAAVPFTYYGPGTVSTLLGDYQSNAKAIDVDLFKRVPEGALAVQITKSGLTATGVAEAPVLLPDKIKGYEIARYRDLAITIRDGIRKLRGKALPDPTRENKTYAHMLGQIFIDPLVPDGNRKPYSWTRASALDITARSGQGQMDFQQVVHDRPFLIIGGTMIWNRPGLVYPRLIPVEYTPLYTGVRQQFGTLGGTYITPWAYDRARVVVSGSRLLVDKANVRMFTLADVIGSSGAAPQLQLMLGDGLPAQVRGPLREAAGAFPAFNPIAVRNGEPVRPQGEVAHGDGGFTDNLGLMPLLARQVGHIIAFVNSNRPAADNDQLLSYFYRLAVQSGSGDKTMNAVFPPEAYDKLLNDLAAATEDGGPAVTCQTLDVKNNEFYNIAAYGGLKMCWVYNHASENWRLGLPDALKNSLDKDPKKRPKDLRRFPYYETFQENKPNLIKLNALQVNLLANLSCWAVTNDVGAKRIANYFGPAVLPAR